MKKNLADAAKSSALHSSARLIPFVLIIMPLIVPSSAMAECDPTSWVYCNPLEGTVGNLVEALTKIVQALLGFIGTIALLFLIIAGITYMTAAGDEEKIKSAKRIVTGTITGLAIALISYSLLVVITTILG